MVRLWGKNHIRFWLINLFSTADNRESTSHLVETEERLAKAAEVEALDSRVEICALQVGGLNLVAL